LSLSVIEEHASDVIHDLSHRALIRDLTKLTRDERVRDMLTRVVGETGFQQFNPWIEGMAAPPRLTDAADRFVGKLIGRASAVQLGYNLISQIGQTVSLVPASLKLGPRRAVYAVANALTLRPLWDSEWRHAAFAMSPELAVGIPNRVKFD
jgi:hypothetical protein